MLTHRMPGGAAVRHSLKRPGDDPRAVSRQTQFSLFQNIDEDVDTFRVKLYVLFGRCADHGQARLRLEEPAFQVTERTIAAADLRVGLVSALEGFSFRAEASAVPFPAGLGYGPLWTGATSVRIVLKGVGGYLFRVHAEGSLKWLSSWDDVREDDDGGRFTIDCEIPFGGVWIETEHPERKDAVVASFRSVFTGHPFEMETDEFADGFVVRARP